MFEGRIDLREKVIQGCSASSALCQFLKDNDSDIYDEVNSKWIDSSKINIMHIMAFILLGDFLRVRCLSSDIFNALDKKMSDHIFLN